MLEPLTLTVDCGPSFTAPVESRYSAATAYVPATGEKSMQDVARLSVLALLGQTSVAPR